MRRVRFAFSPAFLRVLLARGLLALAICLFYLYWRDWPHDVPRYDSLIAAERALPQHNLALPFPEGRNGRYIRFSTQTSGLGYNNVLQELSVFPVVSTFILFWLFSRWLKF